MMAGFADLAKKLAKCNAEAQKMASEINPELLTEQEKRDLDTLVARSGELSRLAALKARENRHAVVTMDDIRRQKRVNRA